MNKIIIIGKVLSNEGTKVTASGITFASLKLDSPEPKYDIQIKCTAFGKVADEIAQVRNESLIMISGRLNISSFTDKEGNKRYAPEIIMDSFNIIADAPKPQLDDVNPLDSSNVDDMELPF